MRLREFAPASGGGSGDYFQARASAWYNGTFDTGSLQKGIKSQEDVERLLNRGIVCPDGKTRKLHIDYNSDFDGVEIYSDDYYEYGDHDATIDSRTGEKWGPYDFMAFSDEDLSEGLTEFAPDDSGDRGEEDALHKYARMWWAGDEATQMQIERALAKMGWEIGEDEGSYNNGGVFVVRAGDVNGDSYTSWAAEDLTEGVAEGSEDPFGPQGRFVGDTGPAQITTTVARVQLKPGDKVLYKPTEQRARIEAMSRDGTQARIHIPSPMGGKTFNCKTSDLKALGALKEKSTSQAQFRTMAAAAHDPKFARKVGIKQSVAREFNKADKGQSYKSLPKKAD